MKKHVFVSRLTVLVVTLCLLLPGVSVYGASANVKSSGLNAPKTIKQGEKFSVKGKITSDIRIKRVEIGVTTRGGGKWTAQKYDNRTLDTNSFDVSKAASKLKFNKLSAGTYFYRIYVHTSDKKVTTVLNRKFTVKSTAKAPYAKGCNYPSSIPKGRAYFIKGTVKSSKNMSQVTVGVVKRSSGKWTAQKTTKKIYSKSFNVARADAKIKFGSLSKGDYYYRIVAKVGKKNYTVLNEPFTVTAPETVESDGNAGVITDGSVKLSNYTVPSNYKVGKKTPAEGTISSTEKINRVEIGIVYASTNKWTSHKYDKKGVNSKTFDIAKADSKIGFSTLPGGTYRYRIYVHTAKGVRLALNHKFTVTPSAKPQQAVKWAKKIAADNSFSYGKKPQTSKVGCYFCGTNKKRKPKGYEKTYVCMTFAHAAYAHGAKDPELLRDCKKGYTCLSTTDENFTDYTCWFKVGYTKDLEVADLQPGDIICYYAADNRSGHLAIYAGNGDIVDAQGIKDCWGPDSIAVRKDKASNYLRGATRCSKKSYVMRYCK
ncbi:MAG: hypothetical protein IKE74_04695 [Mogibacterium sp.]|nr:hypothetical protein [Mogibacterium sp.]